MRKQPPSDCAIDQSKLFAPCTLIGRRTLSIYGLMNRKYWAQDSLNPFPRKIEAQVVRELIEN